MVHILLLEKGGHIMFSSAFINSNSFVIIAVLVTLSIADNSSGDDNNVLGNLFTALGSLFLTKAAQIESNQNQEALKQQINDMEKQIKELKCKLK